MSLTSVKSGRARALEAALLVLRSEGIGGVTMRSVAEEAGMSAPALYWHYADKEALLRDLRREVVAAYRDQAHADSANQSAIQKLKAALEAYRSFAVSEPHYHDLLFLPVASEPGARHTDGMLHFLIERVGDCMRHRELHDGDPASVALTIAAHVHGLVVLYRRRRFESENQFREFYELSIERLLRGIAPG